MNKTWKWGTIAGLKILVKPNALIGQLLLWLLLSIIAILALDLPPVTGIIGGLLAALLHIFSEIWHNLGHAWAARRTGHPMSGIAFRWILGGALYPLDEEELPAAIHIQRALGGPILSATLTLIAGLIALWLRPQGGLGWWLALFLFFDNLLVFSLGALLPLGFTDGSTLLTYWGQR